VVAQWALTTDSRNVVAANPASPSGAGSAIAGATTAGASSVVLKLFLLEDLPARS
jgi:hypothetical protein